jgi:hypothetical protein
MEKLQLKSQQDMKEKIASSKSEKAAHNKHIEELEKEVDSINLCIY